MKKPTSFSIDPQLWGEFLEKTRREGRAASPVLRSLIRHYLNGKCNPFEEPLDWQEQAEIIFTLEEKR